MLTNTLLKIYEITNKTKILETRLGQSLFRTAYFLYKRNFEDVFFPLIKKYPQIFADGHILDVGANIGYTTVLFAQAVSPNYKVFALEPHPANFAKLLSNIEYYNLQDKVIPIQAAVGEKTGEIKLWQNETSHADHRILTDSLNHSLKSQKFQVINVPILTLDDLVKEYNIQEQIKFVKIDVQGYELPVLEGMKKLLEANAKLNICLEYAPDMMQEMGFEKEEIFDYFVNYKKYVVHRRGLRKFNTAEKIDKNSFAKGYGDILFSKQPLWKE